MLRFVLILVQQDTEYGLHVKGHTGRKDNRSLSNKYCDETAKIHMKEARKALRK
jgi:hypothetical protein